MFGGCGGNASFGTKYSAPDNRESETGGAQCEPMHSCSAHAQLLGFELQGAHLLSVAYPRHVICKQEVGEVADLFVLPCKSVMQPILGASQSVGPQVDE